MISVESIPREEWLGEREALIERLYSDTPLRPRLSAPLEGAILLIALRDGESAGCCALVRNSGIDLDGEAPLLLGWFECIDDVEVAAMLFARAAAVARLMGCRSLLGPIDGDTWHSYRVALPSEYPPFFLDVPSRQWYGSLFESSGWRVASSYHSTWMPPAPEADEASVMERLASHEITVRSVEMELYRDELWAIHSLSVTEFADNPFYTPISYESFCDLYAPLESIVDPELVLIAEQDADVVGFVFALGDRFASPGERIVMKSAASSSTVRGMGVGAGLMEIVHARARSRGVGRVIHALMHDSNRSARILSDGSETIRRYRLYRWEQ